MAPPSSKKSNKPGAKSPRQRIQQIAPEGDAPPEAGGTASRSSGATPGLEPLAPPDVPTRGKGSIVGGGKWTSPTNSKKGDLPHGRPHVKERGKDGYERITLPPPVPACRADPL